MTASADEVLTEASDLIQEVPAEVGEMVLKARPVIARLEAKETTLGEAIAEVSNLPAPRAKAVAKPVARPTEITDDTRRALGELPKVFGAVNPTEVRELSEQELSEIHAEREVIQTLLAVLGPRKGSEIREIIANHFDVQAERMGLVTEDEYDEAGNLVKAGTPRDDKGHYVLKQERDVPGTNARFVREKRAGSKPTLTGRALLDAYEAGKITRAQYLACTREERVFDEDKTRTAIRKDPTLLFALQPAVVKGSPETASIRTRP